MGLQGSAAAPRRGAAARFSAWQCAGPSLAILELRFLRCIDGPRRAIAFRVLPGRRRRGSQPLSALASRLTAALARSLSFQTCAAVNTTKRAKMAPSGARMPGVIASNECAPSPTEKIATSTWIAAATKYVMPKTTSALHVIGRLYSQSLMLLTFASECALDRLNCSCEGDSRTARYYYGTS
jgi:hypothetical protein